MRNTDTRQAKSSYKQKSLSISTVLLIINMTSTVALACPPQIEFTTVSSNYIYKGTEDKSTLDSIISSSYHYCTESLDAAVWFGWQPTSPSCGFIPGDNRGYYLNIHFNVPETSAGLWSFRLGPDLGRGGAIFIDGIKAADRAGGVWWAYSWSSPDVMYVENKNISAGEHHIEVIGFEDCCGGYMTLQYKTGDSDWQDVSEKNLSVPGRWTATGSMSLPRQMHSATLLNNGKVMVAGGYNTSSELYDPDAGTWSRTSDTLTTHRNHTATQLTDGRVLVVGGTDSGISTEIYDRGLWTAAGRLNTPRFYHTATRLPDGKVLVVGGSTSEYAGTVLSSAELYDPSTDSWTFTSSMGVARSHHTATALPDGRVLVTGGSDPWDNLLASAEIYDPTSRSWSPAGNMYTGRSYHSAALLKNGKVLVAGGAGLDTSLSASTELFDPTTGIWSPTGSMSKPRREHSATVLSSGWVLVAGGYHEYTGILSTSEVYNPSTGTWSPLENMNVDRYLQTATLLKNGRVLAAGGISTDSQSSAEYYDACGN